MSPVEEKVWSLFKRSRTQILVMFGGKAQSPRKDNQSNIHVPSLEQYHTQRNQFDKDLHQNGSKVPCPSDRQQKTSQLEDKAFEFLQRFVSGCLHKLDKWQGKMKSWSDKASAFPLIVSHGSKKEEIQEQEEENDLGRNKHCLHKQDTNIDNDCDKHNCNIHFHKSESDNATEKQNGKETFDLQGNEPECLQDEDNNLQDLSPDIPGIHPSNSTRGLM
jgi:hypothetical protein